MYCKYIVSIKFNEEIRIVVNGMFPILNTEHQALLTDYIMRLIIILCGITYNNQTENSVKIFINQLRQNNYQDIKWLLTFLIPYINKDTNLTLTSLNELYTAKYKDVNINLEEPNYIYSNFQYGRTIRDGNIIKELQFDKSHLDQNFYLLIDTIKTMSHKSYVNWMDIVPISLKSYKSTQLYIDTKEKMDTNMLQDWDPLNYMNIKSDYATLCQNMEYTRGLHIGDIYNTLANDLYYNIADVKWLIYILTDEDEEEENSNILRPFISIINDLFDYEENENYEWTKLSDSQKIKNSIVWDQLVKYSISNMDYSQNDYLNAANLRIFIKGLIQAYENHSTFTDKEYIYIGKKKVLSDEIKNEKIIFENIIDSLKSIKIENMYNFIHASIKKFNTTWFATIADNENYLNLNKFIYNFAKNLVHYTDNNKWVAYPRYWRELTDTQQKEILKRLNNGYDVIEWFNIFGNIRKIFSVTNKIEIEIKNIQIYINIKNILADIIFDVLIKKGVLSKFVPTPNKTDTLLLPDQTRDNIYTLQNEIFKEDDTNEHWTSSYHYLTCEPYKKLPIFFATNKKPNPWYDKYMYDWISQIGFCHKFVHNRIMFITGATGVGKSVEAPKMFLYNSIALDYIKSPKIACTQPRQAPTSGNAQRVSKLLGVPIYATDIDLNEKDKLKKTNNFYIQMKHQDEYHTQITKTPTLKYLTDGTLMLEISNPLLKLQKQTKKGEIYFDTNLYDIILIDEAHEHKINMDLLLTYLKHHVAYNNSIRLGIVSATMDADEPKYRRYYRDINDNRKYPCDRWIEKHKLDRINIDRRLHISPPDFTTRYNITDIYVPDKSIPVLVKEIIETSPGDILIFQPGEAEIKSLVIELNNITPTNTIAIPFYRNLEKNKKDIIQNIGDTRKRSMFKMSKQDDISIVEDVTIGTSTYSRFIIIATDIAEASITIDTLKFVIDNGVKKVAKYNMNKKGNTLTKEYISESSRVQRRGRVGRTSPGTAYYMYKKGTMLNNKIPYEISTNNIFQELFVKLRLSTKESLFINGYDFNKPNNYLPDMSQIEKIAGLKKIIKKQYFNGEKYYEYYGDNKMYDYNNYALMLSYYETGFDATSLTDKNGKFYIINPDELDIKRNINGDIVGCQESKYLKYIKDNGGYINSEKIMSFWKLLVDYMYVNFENNDLVQSIMGDIIIKLAGLNNKVEHHMIRSFIFCANNELRNDLVKFITFSNIINYDISKIYITPKTQLVKNKNGVSDVKFIINILNEMHNIIRGGTSINEWCKIKSLNVKVFDDYIKKYNKNFITEKLNISHNNFLEDISLKLTNSTDINKYDTLSTALALGFFANVCKKIKKSKYYLSVYAPTPENVYSITLLNYTDIKNTTMQNMYTENYLLFLKPNLDTNDISCLHYLSPEHIKVLDIYNQKHFRDINISDEKMQEYISLLVHATNTTQNKSDIINMLMNYSESYNEMKQELGNIPTNIIQKLLK
jgi:hypothetical protein